MQTKVMNITPTLAKEWLERNTINRPLRPGGVAGWVRVYERGEHKLTHQGIAFADSGELLDGQHRLTALTEMPASFSVSMQVTTGLPAEASKGMDQGRTRSHSDVLAVPMGLAAVARYIALITETSRIGITSQFLVPFVEGTRDPYETLTNFCPKITKTWSSASVRSAAILRMLNGGDYDYITISYNALNHLEFDSMSPVVTALYRQQQRSKITRDAKVVRGLDLFCRAYRAFDSRSQNIPTIQLSDMTRIVAQAREIINEKVLGISMKKAPSNVGAKKVKSANSKAGIT